MNRPPSRQLGEREPPSRINAIVANTVSTVLQMAVVLVIIVLALIAAMGIGSVAIGFAVRHIFEDFLTGIIILLRRERRIGDFSGCQGIEGRVGEHPAPRDPHTTHRRPARDRAQQHVVQEPACILTDCSQRRTTVVYGVAYGEYVDTARNVIRDAVKGCPGVLTDNKPVQIFAQEFDDSSINLEATRWTGSSSLDVRQTRNAAIASVKNAFE